MLSVGVGREIDMDVEWRDPADRKTLAQRLRREKNATQRDRYRAVWLALRGFTAPQVTDKLDRSRRNPNKPSTNGCTGLAARTRGPAIRSRGWRRPPTPT